MPVNEIEIPGTSISIRCLSFKAEEFSELFTKIQEEADQFCIDPEEAGFHDCDRDDECVRGFFSIIVPFKVEHLVEGIVTKTMHKRIESCEFIATNNILYVWGKIGPQKILEHILAGLTGYGVVPIEFEFRHLSQFQERLTSIKNVKLTNPKDREIRRATLVGKMETYTEYNVIDPKNHGIESVSGILDTRLGPLTVTAGRKGTLRLTVKRGFIMTLECLQWLVSRIRDEAVTTMKETIRLDTQDDEAEAEAEIENDQASAEDEAEANQVEQDRAMSEGGGGG